MKLLLIIAVIIGFICLSNRKIHYTSPSGETWVLFNDMLKRFEIVQ